MKVGIGAQLHDDAWGGGNQFIRALARSFEACGDVVSFDLAQPDLDIILMVEPDLRHGTGTFAHREILRYLLTVNRRAIVVHRINNSSEARDDPERNYNRFRINANRVADHTIFVSDWVRKRYVACGFDPERSNTIILNGADAERWHPSPHRQRASKWRVVTHHWSTNQNKGFEVYRRLDQMLTLLPWCDRAEFTYIGRLPDGMRLEAARHAGVLSGDALVDEVGKHDIYLTASAFEAGGNHFSEGALCGLPVLYLDSGGTPEYCAGYGLAFTPDTFEQMLNEMMDKYDHWSERVKTYPHTSQAAARAYRSLFEELLTKRDDLIARRHLWRRPLWLARTLAGR